MIPAPAPAGGFAWGTRCAGRSARQNSAGCVGSRFTFQLHLRMVRERRWPLQAIGVHRSGWCGPPHGDGGVGAEGGGNQCGNWCASAFAVWHGRSTGNDNFSGNMTCVFGSAVVPKPSVPDLSGLGARMRDWFSGGRRRKHRAECLAWCGFEQPPAMGLVLVQVPYRRPRLWASSLWFWRFSFPGSW